MTTTPESLLEQARAIWPAIHVENGELIGAFEDGSFSVTPLPSGRWQLFWSGYPDPIDIATDQVIDAIRFVRDAWWDRFSQQEGAISDLEQQVLADSSSAAPVVWLRLQQIKQWEGDKHRMMVRVERRRIWDMKASILAIVRSYEAGEISTLEPAIEVLRGLIPEHCQEGDAL